jgi:hypothetical protein
LLLNSDIDQQQIVCAHKYPQSHYASKEPYPHDGLPPPQSDSNYNDIEIPFAFATNSNSQGSNSAKRQKEQSSQKLKHPQRPATMLIEPTVAPDLQHTNN